MRVVLAQLTNFPESGRVDIYEYAKSLAVLGIDVHVVICRSTAKALPPNLVVHELNLSTNPGPVNSTRFALQAKQIIQKIAEEKTVDIVHLFNPAPATYITGWLLKLSPNRPRIIYDIRTGGIGTSLDSHIINAMAKTAVFFSDGIITISSGLYARLFGKKKLCHATVPLGVATERYRTTRRTKKEQFIFIYIGSLHKNRHIPLMVEAFLAVYKTHPQARLTIVGAGNDSETLANLIKLNKLTDIVTIVPTVPFEQIPQMLAQANCGLSFVPIVPWFNPQTPLKTIEYLASNLPVVATATDSHRELWHQLPQELLCKDTAEDFSRGMQYALENCENLRRINFQAVAEPFDWKAITRKSLIPFYQKVAGQ
jgi:glycosyltransferase involved in cell wall biosynthesis